MVVPARAGPGIRLVTQGATWIKHSKSNATASVCWIWSGLIIGIVVGTGIFETPPLIFQHVPDLRTGMAVWVVAGLLCLLGALCYAELACTYPRTGGDYIYLTRAYGPGIGFLFAWAQLAVILPANIGMMAYVFSDYALKLGDFSHAGLVYALAAVLTLTALNILGFVLGRRTQNVLTVA